jgi:hypothetical protein
LLCNIFFDVAASGLKQKITTGVNAPLCETFSPQNHPHLSCSRDKA